MKNREIISAIEFIFSECMRYVRMSKEDWKSVHIYDALTKLPAPKGAPPKLRNLTCGREAIWKLDKIVEELVRRDKSHLAERIHYSLLRETLGAAIIQRYVIENIELTVQQIDNLLIYVSKEVKKNCHSWVYFYPCRLMNEQEPGIIQMGPVSIMNKEKFFSYLTECMERTFSVVGEGDDLRKKRIEDARHYYEDFGWVAKVEINNCDDQASRQRALRAIFSTLNCICLIFGAANSNEMVIGGKKFSSDIQALFYIRDGDKLDATVTYSWHGNSFGKGWSTHLVEHYYQQFISLCGAALESEILIDEFRPLSFRFLDAVHWFGEAVRETSPATKLVKYVMAIERMVTTKESEDAKVVDNLRRKTADRVAALCCLAHLADDFEEYQSQAKRIYDLRSDLVHGSLSPHDESIYAGIKLAEKMCQETLLSAITGIGEDGLRQSDYSDKQLNDWYNRVVEKARNNSSV